MIQNNFFKGYFQVAYSSQISKYHEISVEFMQNSLNNMSMQNSWDLKCKTDTKKIKIKFYTNDMVF